MKRKSSREDQIALIDRIMRELVWHSQKQASHTLTRPEIALTLPQMITLFAIHGSGTCRMSTLAEITQQSAGTLTGIVDRLIDDGLVERARSASDRRVVEVMLTENGERRLREATNARQDDVRQVLESFDDTDLAEFQRLLQRFLDGVQSESTDDVRRNGHLLSDA